MYAKIDTCSTNVIETFRIFSFNEDIKIFFLLIPFFSFFLFPFFFFSSRKFLFSRYWYNTREEGGSSGFAFSTEVVPKSKRLRTLTLSLSFSFHGMQVIHLHDRPETPNQFGRKLAKILVGTHRCVTSTRILKGLSHDQTEYTFSISLSSFRPFSLAHYASALMQMLISWPVNSTANLVLL